MIGKQHSLPESAWTALAIMGANSNAGNTANSKAGAWFTEIICIYESYEQQRSHIKI